MNEAVKWNPHNKVVQDHRTGNIDHQRTNAVRRMIGLPTPWTPELATFEQQLPPIYDVLPQSGIQSGLWVNKKKGTIYRVFDETINTTNAQDGQLMIAYRDVTNMDKLPFVREVTEFRSKFTISEED